METRYFTVPATDAVPSHRLACYQWGNPSSPAVFCLHGLTRNGRDFDYLAEALSHDFFVIAPDMAGRGLSDTLQNPALYAYPTYVADCAALISQLGISKLHWVGTSMGGIVGMMMAALPGLMRTLTLNDVGCLIPASGLKRIFSYAGAKTSFTSRAEAENTLRKNAATFGIKTVEQWQHFFDITIVEKGGIFTLACDPAITANFPKFEEVKDVNLWGFWEAMTKLPMLVVHGERSDILPKEIAQEMKAKHLDLTLYEVPGAGHAPALMDEKDTSFIHGWLNQHR